MTEEVKSMFNFFSSSSNKGRYPSPNRGGSHYQKGGFFKNFGSFSSSGSGRRRHYQNNQPYSGQNYGQGYQQPYPNQGYPQQPASQGSSQICPSCGTQVPAGSKFCLSCGAKMNTAAFCTNCGKPVPPGSKFCPECGSSINQ